VRQSLLLYGSLYTYDVYTVIMIKKLLYYDIILVTPESSTTLKFCVEVSWNDIHPIVALILGFREVNQGGVFGQVNNVAPMVTFHIIIFDKFRLSYI
jgi:hypothetical protein